jgi:hypothetical protein
VFEVADAPDAEDTLSRVGRADVVVSDVVLPGGVSGSDFCRKGCQAKSGHQSAVYVGLHRGRYQKQLIPNV